ncbi:MAG: LEA type 2 family protein [Treponema sp.]|nr:LEA type 2 family protein [Treponema sp.]
MRKQISTKMGFIAAFLALMTLTTCQTLGSLVTEPVVTLHSVEVTNINFTGVEILCKVNVQNPNSVDVPFPEIDWEFFINANSFVKGQIKAGRAIKARRTTTVEVPLSLSYLEVFNTFASLKGTNQADYKIALGARFNLPILHDKTWQFEHEGTFPVLQIPKLSAPSMKIDQLDFTKAELLFTIDVNNPNPFELPFPQMAYDYLVNNNSFIKNSVGIAAPLAAAAITPVLIKLTVNYVDLYQAFQNLRNANEVPGLLSLKTDFGIPAFIDEVVSTQAAGSLPLLKIPSLNFTGIRVKSTSLTKIDFEVTWEIENNNGFAMNLRDLSYNLAVNNSQWSTGKIPGSPQIAANRKTPVSMDFSLSSLNMVKEITEIITRGTDVSYLCSGNISLGAALPGLDSFNQPFNFSGTTKIRR